MMTGITTGWAEEMPALKIELMANGSLRLEATDPYDNGDDVVEVHPLQLRLAAEKLGLVPQLSASEAENLRTINKLARRLRVLHERIKQVHEWMWENKSFDQCDINIEAWYIDATLDLSAEFQAEIEESRVVVTPRNAESRPPRAVRDQVAPGARLAAPAAQLDLGVDHD
ncbi:hypothetical protein EJP67_02285 [Variovorax guangxiensis]|uniref:Uncharacterized protein n=1 Tax=Variovorax guangxiensis TaxID=1775474 RepID=A0A3S0XBZ0_9BURK|nr:hypothetical protein [Variovorax guangxiensis]RUR65882.1 hypothetical protein EJP67_02285 [Variovorax guangxiensis]